MNIENDAPQSPVIDWELGIKLAGNNRALAVDMLKIFAKNLPDEINAIRQAINTHDETDLLLHLHKLRGGVSYCGLPRLKKIIVTFEKEVKKHKIKNSNAFFVEFESESVLVLEHISCIRE
jgi:two-component system sensor histidine kinase BarA